MEEQSQTLLATLRKSSAPIETKIAAFNKVKSDIKHLRVPEACQSTIFECIRLAIASQQSPTLVAAGLSTLGHLTKRLALQEQTDNIVFQIPKLLPLLLDRLGDARESHRNAASQNLAELWHYQHADVEKVIREAAVAGNNARAKEMGMMWVVKMNREQGLQFKAFVPQLVACLEDADGMVRETAKSVIIELFSNAPERAKQDLQKQMAARDVRKAIVNFITSQLDMQNSVDLDLSASAASAPIARSQHHAPDPPFSHSLGTENAPHHDQVEPFFVHSQRDLEHTFQDMLPHFEGRETEHNWGPRDKDITKLRRLVAGNAPAEFHGAFVTGIKATLEGILKVSNSLRTTHSSNGCELVQELARKLGSSIDVQSDLLLQTFIKMSANTKPIASSNGSTTVDILLSNLPYHKRLLEHMWFSIQDKNVQVRTFAAGWLKTLLTKHARSRSQIEHSGGLDLIDKCLKKGLADANPKVREGTRATYWAFAQIWAHQAEGVMDTLDAKSKQLLEKDANNPNASSLASSISSTTSAAAKTKAGAFNGRQSVREAIAAQKRAMAAKVERPMSAQSILSTTSTSDIATSRPAAARTNAPRAPTSSTTSARAAVHTSTNSVSGSSLLSAPVRRPRRPEQARPATADPYAQSRRDAAQTPPTMSPANSPGKSRHTAVPRTATKTSAPRPKTPTVQTTVRSKSRLGESSLPRPSPKSKAFSDASVAGSPRGNDHMTMINIPFTQAPDDANAYPRHWDQRVGSTEKTLSPAGLTGFDDVDADFTMIGIPGVNRTQGHVGNDQSHIYRASPASRPTSSGSQFLQVSRSAKPSPEKPRAEGLNNSPLQRLRTPEIVRSPRSIGTPTRLGNEESSRPPVQIYEDPNTEDEEMGVSEGEDPHKPVLEELPLNERAPERAASEDAEIDELSQSTRSNEQNIEANGTPRSFRGHHKTTSTGSVVGVNEVQNSMGNGADVTRSRRLLASGIDRIRSRTLDAHGFRRVQELVKSKQDIWGEENQRYGELLLALIEYLDSSPATAETASSGTAPRATNLKAQVLATIRAMISLHRRLAAPYIPRTLCALLRAKRQFDDSSHVAAEMERAVDEIIKQASNLSDSLDAVLTLVENASSSRDQSPASTASSSSSSSAPIVSNSNPTEKNSRTLILSLTALSTIISLASPTPAALASPTKRQPFTLSTEQETRLGSVAVKYLDDTEADVRKADLDFCLSCYEVLGREVFWQRFMKGAREMHVNLIMYYIARRGKA